MSISTYPSSCTYARIFYGNANKDGKVIYSNQQVIDYSWGSFNFTPRIDLTQAILATVRCGNSYRYICRIYKIEHIEYIEYNI